MISQLLEIRTKPNLDHPEAEMSQAFLQYLSVVNEMSSTQLAGMLKQSLADICCSPVGTPDARIPAAQEFLNHQIATLVHLKMAKADLGDHYQVVHDAIVDLLGTFGHDPAFGFLELIARVVSCYLLAGYQGHTFSLQYPSRVVSVCEDLMAIVHGQSKHVLIGSDDELISLAYDLLNYCITSNALDYDLCEFAFPWYPCAAKWYATSERLAVTWSEMYC